LKSFPEPQAIVYCSDHGIDQQVARITMFVYLSEALQKARPGLSRKIKALSEKKFTHIDMDKLLLEIMDISVRKNVPRPPSLHK
jgi:glucan phosphoethanolaminetransferase (alkaline phosphatase superfamily)